MEPLGRAPARARPRVSYIARLGLGAHGGANGLVPLLPASLCELDKAIRIALGERHAEKCAMRKTLSEVYGLCLVSLKPNNFYFDS